MKASKILLAGALTLSLANLATAQTVVHITGSTAFRKATMVAIEHLMPGFTGAYVTGAGITSELNASKSILSGSISGISGTVIVKCSWAGSVGGVQTVVQNLNVSTWLANSVLPGSGVAALASGTFDAPAPADVTMSDSFQASSGFGSPVLIDQQVGVVPFEWVANNGCPSTVNNITPLLAQALLSGGIPLSQFTGNSADAGVPVYAMGRNFDSGTRLSELAETEVGIFGNVQQMQPTISGTPGPAGTITALNLWPAETVLGIPFGIGQSGFNGGGDLANALATPGSSTAGGSAQFGPGWLIGYLGRNDAVTACSTTAGANTAHRLTYNGYADWTGPSGAGAVVNDTPIKEGQYSCWEYEHLMYRSTYTAPGKTVADRIANQILTVDAVQSGILSSVMDVSKPVEGGLITHL